MEGRFTKRGVGFLLTLIAFNTYGGPIVVPLSNIIKI